MEGHRSFRKQLPYSSHSVFLYGWEIKKLSCRHQNFTPATMWFVVWKRIKHRPRPPSRHVLRRHRYLLHLSMCAFLIKIRQICPLSNLNSNLQEIHVDAPLTEFNCYDAGYNTNMATDICFETI